MTGTHVPTEDDPSPGRRLPRRALLRGLLLVALVAAGGLVAVIADVPYK
jgi:hypothetical protein